MKVWPWGESKPSAALDAEYVRRDEVEHLLMQVAEAEVAVASVTEKLNTMAARFRRRQLDAMKSLEKDMQQPQEQQEIPLAHIPVGSKQELRARFHAMKQNGGLQ